MEQNNSVELQISVDENLTLLQRVNQKMDYMEFLGMFEKVALLIKKNVSVNEKLSFPEERRLRGENKHLTEEQERDFLKQYVDIEKGFLDKSKGQLSKEFGLASSAYTYRIKKLRKKYGLSE